MARLPSPAVLALAFLLTSAARAHEARDAGTPDGGPAPAPEPAAEAQPASVPAHGHPEHSASEHSASEHSASEHSASEHSASEHSPPEHHHPEEQHHVLQTTVEAPGPTSAASAETLRDRDLQLRPRASPQDILRVVPGLVTAQHQGGGKADQLFLRGFDADHGTDVALFVDGVPVNLPSHGHGQGYADLHFLIPEAIDRVDVAKGPYFAEYGDFATAGAVNLRTRRSFGESSLSASYGSFGAYRVLGIVSPELSEGLPWLAAEVSGIRGPFLSPWDLQRYNVFAKETLALNTNTTVAVLASLYGSQWASSGQIPLRAVESGLLDRFGAIDPTEGGQTQRQMLVATLEQRGGTRDLVQVSAYAVRYRLQLYSNFTFQLRDPVESDQMEQDDSRFYTGINARYRHTARVDGMKLVTTLGAQGRFDDIRTGRWHTRQRERLAGCYDEGINPCNDAQVTQSNLGVYLEEDARVNDWLRVVAGVRADLFEWAVNDLKPPGAPGGAGPTTGIAQRSVVNPKLQVVLRPLPGWDLYLDGGGGFHSNDARGVIASRGEGALPRAWGGEVGTRVRLWDRLDVAAALWGMTLESEQVFSADAGGTEPSSASRRYGLDLELRWEVLPWLWADADFNLSHAGYVDSDDAVPLAPTRTATLGVTAQHPAGYKGRLGVRHVGDRPATEDRALTAEGYTLVDVTLGYRWRFVEVGVVVENLFNTPWREAQFGDFSQLRAAPYNEPEPVRDIHFTPGNPLSVRGTVSFYY